MQKLLLTLLLCTAVALVGSAQITIPNSFTAGTTISSSTMNANFTEIGTKALNRTGGTITGTVSVDSAVTIDGVDLSAAIADKTSTATISGTWTFSAAPVLTGLSLSTAGLALTGTGAGALDVAGGVNAGSGNVGIVDTTGKIPAISSTYFANLSGANLTSLSASNISSGTLGVDRLPAGGIVQVVAAADSTNTTSATSSYATTGLSANITPSSASNKVLVLVSINGIKADSGCDTGVALKLQRGGSDLQLFASKIGLDNASGQYQYHSASTTYYDSPASTSALTYSVVFSNAGNCGTVGTETDANVSTITLMEVRQ